MTVTAEWQCANGHVFTYGDEAWHLVENQGYLDSGAPIPTHCQADWEEEDMDEDEDLDLVGEPCMDSSSLRPVLPKRRKKP